MGPYLKLLKFFKLEHIQFRTDQVMITINLLLIGMAFIFGLHDFITDYLRQGYWGNGTIRVPMMFAIGTISLSFAYFNFLKTARIITSSAFILVFYVVPLIVDVPLQEMVLINSLVYTVGIFIFLLMFDVLENSKLLLFFLLLTFVSNVGSEVYLIMIKSTENSEFRTFYVKHYNIIIMIKLFSGTFIYTILYYLFRKNELYQKEILESHAIIESQKNEIESQNEELIQAQEELKVINENLEKIIHQRTSDIETKNSKLLEYAYINSHLLRSPVARIKGLINLIEISKDAESHDEYLNYLKISISELDDIVISISQILNNEDQERLSEIQTRIRKLYSNGS
jgi:signal transduction histidine kinase